MDRRRPKTALVSRPIPALTQLASAFALGALAGASGCKSEGATADRASPNDAAPAPTLEAVVDAQSEASLDSGSDGGSLDDAAASGDSTDGAVASRDGGACIAGGAACAHPGGIATLPNVGNAFANLHDMNAAGGLAMRPMDAAGTGSFDKSGAQASLNAVAGSLATCKGASGTAGHGHVAVEFGTNGKATNVVVAPPFAGTPEGACIKARFLRAHVAPYEGAPATVYRGFDIK